MARINPSNGSSLPFDRAVEKLAALGVPAIVLIVVIATSGLTGGAAIVAALATLGGPLGMLGGLALLGVLVLISNAIAQWGVDALLRAVLERMKANGKTERDIIREVEAYWFLSRSRKTQVREYLKALHPSD